MIAAVADTHAALWYLMKSPDLSKAARTFIESAAAAGSTIAVSAISLAEIVYLSEKKRIPVSLYQELRQALDDAEFVFEEVPFNGEIVESMRLIRRDDVPDMPDRIVAATALYFRVPVISRDGCIRTSNIPVIW